jgi:N,N'-diacetylchitobiose phosphorylase
MPVDLAQHAQAAGGYLLADAHYGTFLTAAGTGYSAWNDLALTRWNPDLIEGGGGLLLYFRDVESRQFWLFGQAAETQDSRFCGGIAKFRQQQNGIEALIEICVAPDADLELRRITLRNLSDQPQRIELTSYAEVVLNHWAADAAHPAFSKLFIQTEWAAESQALLARRRPRSHEELPCWLVHALVGESAGKGEGVQYETDRARFIGRGYSLAAPRALKLVAPLSGTVGNVLDPIVSLRQTVELAAGGVAQVTFLLGAASEREAALALATGYQQAAEINAAFAAAASRDTSSPSPTVPQRFTKIPPAPLFQKGEAQSGGFTDQAKSALQFWNGYGGFNAAGDEYVIRLEPDADGRLKLPPQPWVNIIANPQFGFITSETGAGSTWSQNSRENRLTPWFNDPVLDPHGEALYLRDEADGTFWSVLPGPIPQPVPCEVRHGFGYSRYRQLSQGLEQQVWLFVPREDPVKITRIRLHNHRDQPCRLALYSYARLVLGVLPGDHAVELTIESDAATGALLAENRNGEFAGRIAFAAGAPTDPIPIHVTGDRAEFIGLHGSPAQPAALWREALSGQVGAGLDPCFALQITLTLEPGEAVEYAFLLGEAADRDEARRLIDRYREDGAVETTLTEVQTFWRDWLAAVQIETPDPALNLMVNGWLAYQTLSCRLWGRSAFYQSGGAFGFRDQLQDAAALIYHDPQLTRRQLLLHAAHQFAEGDVLHWWHPPGGRGIRSRCSDDRLWLPYLAAFHARVTGDWSLFGEPVRFLKARPLQPGEDEAFLTPENSGETATLYEHCCRALDRSLTQGVHGLPLMGTGDWNDGMNRVGRQGRGESVWLGFFLYATLGEFIPVCGQHGDHNRTRRYAAFRRDLAEALNQHGWDGDWYRRAWDDDGAMLGSNTSAECRIDALAQAWAVLAKAAPWGRAETAMDAVERHLVSEADGLIRLLTPPFVNTLQDPGYIKGYVAGVRGKTAASTLMPRCGWCGRWRNWVGATGP